MTFKGTVCLYALLILCIYLRICITLTGANNLVPMELALKIAEKIGANERFSVYIVIPMWPEGVPSSAAVQEILFWQVRLFSCMFPC